MHTAFIPKKSEDLKFMQDVIGFLILISSLLIVTALILYGSYSFQNGFFIVFLKYLFSISITLFGIPYLYFYLAGKLVEKKNKVKRRALKRLCLVLQSYKVDCEFIEGTRGNLPYIRIKKSDYREAQIFFKGTCKELIFALVDKLSEIRALQNVCYSKIDSITEHHIIIMSINYLKVPTHHLVEDINLLTM